MRRALVRTGLFLIAAVTFLHGASMPPHFIQFPANTARVIAPVELKLTTIFQKHFKTQIVRQSKGPPNFAGIFRVAEWGCGSSCVSIAVINLRSGLVYDGPFVVLGYGEPHKYEGGDAELEYKTSSRLLVARGCPEDRNCGTYYFEWTGDHFRQLRQVLAQANRSSY
jgi:hypothetical protein